MALPSGYKRLEYIQSSGTQYINAGFKPNQNTRVVMDAAYTETNSTTVFYFGARTGYQNSAFCLRLSNSNTNWMSEYAATSQYHTADSKQRQIVDFNKNTVSIGTTTWTHSAATFQCSCNLILFGLNNGGETTDYAKALRLYSCQIYDNGTPIRDYIPCQTTAGEIGLWDDANSVFYGNAGTGTFTAGPVVNLGGIFVKVNGVWKQIDNITVNVN